MNRTIVLGMIILGLVIASAALTARWIVLELSGASLASGIGAAAAVVQAITAIAIVVLSWELARTARGALRAAEDQAEAAGKAVEEAHRASRDLRVERELSVLPLLDLRIRTNRDALIESAFRDDTLVLKFEVTNLSSHPATSVSVTALPGPWNGQPPDSSGAPDERLAESWTTNAIPALGELSGHEWQFPNSGLPEVLLLRLQYSGILGGTVWQTYEQNVAATTFAWNASQRYVQPSVRGADPIVSDLR